MTALDFFALRRGDELPPMRFEVSEEAARAYLDATGEPAEHWEGRVPPLALGAVCLGELMERLPLPAGAVHTGQEFEFRGVVPAGRPVEASVRVAQRSELRGAVIVALDLELRCEGEPVVRGRATVMAPSSTGVS